MGNTVVWKPAHTQQFAAHFLMALLEEAGLPPGVINMVTGDGIAVSDVALADPDLAGIHFTGSTRVFQLLWAQVGENIAGYRSYPRIVGETGGKDFVVAHPSADVDVLRTAMVRGAFEYQGQKCSAASRAYVPRSLWEQLRDDLAAEVDALTMGPTTDLSNFMGAVIDDRAFGRLSKALDRARGTDSISVLAGGTYDDSEGWFVRPTVLVGTDPTDEIFTTEYFGPILAVHVYDDADYLSTLRQMESASPYALTGSVIAQDRAAIAEAHARAAVRGGQLLHQRQADRRGRRAAAVRRWPGQRHQRQGRRTAEPAALDVHPVDQGDVRARHGRRVTPIRADAGRYPQPCGQRRPQHPVVGPRMLSKLDDAKAELLDRAAHAAGPAGDPGDVAFLHRYYRRVAPEDLSAATRSTSPAPRTRTASWRGTTAGHAPGSGSSRRRSRSTAGRRGTRSSRSSPTTCPSSSTRSRPSSGRRVARSTWWSTRSCRWSARSPATSSRSSTTSVAARPPEAGFESWIHVEIDRVTDAAELSSRSRTRCAGCSPTCARRSRTGRRCAPPRRRGRRH